MAGTESFEGSKGRGLCSCLYSRVLWVVESGRLIDMSDGNLARTEGGVIFPLTTTTSDFLSTFPSCFQIQEPSRITC